jgi:Transcriptional regulators
MEEKFMSGDKGINVENIIFSYIEEFKFLLFPDRWSGALLDYTKSEILTLLCLYKYKTANMTEISEFILSPLNTTTGVVSRLEKKNMVERIRSQEDRRVVQIELTGKAKELIEEEKSIITDYFKRIYEVLTEEEKSAVLSIFTKIVRVNKQGNTDFEEDKPEVKKVKRITIE